MRKAKAPTALPTSLDRLYRWRGFPAALHVPLLAVTLALLVLAVHAPRHSEMNLGAALVWQIWWPLLPFSVLLMARSWCALCPFAALASLAQRLRPKATLPPPAWLRRVGPWFATVSLALVGFLFLLLSLESSGSWTAVLLTAFALGSTAAALLWQGRAWCRYLCPVGLLLGLYSRLAWLRLEPQGREGRQAAIAGGRVCPLFTSPAAVRRAHDCVLCSNCLRVPGGEAVAVRLGPPSLAGQILARPEAIAVSVLTGLLLVDALRMTPSFLRYMAWAVPRLHGAYEPAMALGIGGLVLLLLLAQGSFALWQGRGREFWPWFARLSVTLLPLALAAQLALSAQHLLVLGEVVRNLGAELRLLSPGHMPPSDAYSFLWPVKLLQGAMLVGGAGVSLRYSTRLRRGPGGYSPAVASALVSVVLLAVFVEPMSVTC